MSPYAYSAKLWWCQTLANSTLGELPLAIALQIMQDDSRSRHYCIIVRVSLKFNLPNFPWTLVRQSLALPNFSATCDHRMHALTLTRARR